VIAMFLPMEVIKLPKFLDFGVLCIRRGGGGSFAVDSFAIYWRSFSGESFLSESLLSLLAGILIGGVRLLSGMFSFLLYGLIDINRNMDI